MGSVVFGVGASLVLHRIKPPQQLAAQAAFLPQFGVVALALGLCLLSPVQAILV